MPNLDEDLYQDSDGDYYYKVIWYEIYAWKCPTCKNKGISVIDRTTAEMFKNNVDYCYSCGYQQGVLKQKELESASSIEFAVQKGYYISPDDFQIIRKIYPTINL